VAPRGRWSRGSSVACERCCATNGPRILQTLIDGSLVRGFIPRARRSQSLIECFERRTAVARTSPSQGTGRSSSRRADTHVRSSASTAAVGARRSRTIGAGSVVRKCRPTERTIAVTVDPRPSQVVGVRHRAAVVDPAQLRASQSGCALVVGWTSRDLYVCWRARHSCRGRKYRRCIAAGTPSSTVRNVVVTRWAGASLQRQRAGQRPLRHLDPAGAGGATPSDCDRSRRAWGANIPRW
jgi:hypothetical protein